MSRPVRAADHFRRPPLNRLVVRESATLFEAMAALDAAAQAVVLVADGRGRVTGLLTDGDLRRALLAGRSLHECALREVMRRDFTWVGPTAGRAEVIDLMRARSINHIPILDASRRLIGLHTLRRLLGAVERPNWAILMAGGKGVRLRPITETIPKPMIRVAGRPILERLVLHLVSHGIRRIFIAVNYLAHIIEDYFGDGDRLGCKIEYLRERTPLGTGGALGLLPRRPQFPILVMNGDLVTDVDLGELLEFHDSGGYAMTIGLRPHALEVPYGVATVRGNRLTALTEKPRIEMLVNAGVYVVSPRAVSMVRKHRPCLLPDLAQRCLDRRLAVGACRVRAEWIDIGHQDQLKKARGEE